MDLMGLKKKVEKNLKDNDQLLCEGRLTTRKAAQFGKLLTEVGSLESSDVKKLLKDPLFTAS